MTTQVVIDALFQAYTKDGSDFLDVLPPELPRQVDRAAASLDAELTVASKSAAG